MQDVPVRSQLIQLRSALITQTFAGSLFERRALTLLRSPVPPGLARETPARPTPVTATVLGMDDQQLAMKPVIH